MKNLILIASFLLSSATFACADLSKKPGWLGHKQIKCGTLFHTIVEPKMRINGKVLPFGFDLGDMWGGCPDTGRGCYPPYLNIQRQGTAICKAYGFKKYGDANDFSAFKRKPDELAVLKRDAGGKYRPRIARVNHSRSEYSWVKSIRCIPDFSKR